MRHIATLLLSSLGFLAVAGGAPGYAAPVEAVIAACDKMADAKPGSCNYTTTDSGIHGCTAKVCFTCPADGKRQCHASAMRNSRPRAGTIGSVELELPRSGNLDSASPQRSTGSGASRP